MLKLGDVKGRKCPGRDLYSVNFADYLPETLKRDSKMKALAAAVTEQMLGVSAGIENVLIYSRIDGLPEELIDILAFDMHVDWYDYSYPLELKRNILKSSVRVHKKMGTKYAVEKALKAFYPESGVEEWFEYGGRPYTFRVKITIGSLGMAESMAVQLIKKMWYYKNLRSHCECISFTLNAQRATIRAAPYLKSGTVLKVKARPEKGIQGSGKKVAVAGMETGQTIKVRPETACIE